MHLYTHNMPLTDIEDIIAATQAKIRSLEWKLIHLRRLRNALLLICALPAELVIRILQTLADDHAAYTVSGLAGNRLRRFAFPWRSATQFCAYWRALALDCPSIWSFIVTARGLFSTFMKRSKHSLLDICAWEGRLARDDWKQMLQSIATNMHRVRSLNIQKPDASDISSLRNIPAAELTSLSFASPSHIRCAPRQPFDPINKNVMPKLRRLEVFGCTLFDWNILPSHLLNVTKVVLDFTYTKDQLNILHHCTAVRELMIRTAGTFGNWELLQDSPLKLPNLQHLRLEVEPPREYLRMSLPSIKRITLILPFYTDINRRPAMNRAWQMITEFFEPFINSTHPDTLIHHFTLGCYSNMISFVARSIKDEPLVDIEIRDVTHPENIDPWRFVNFFTGAAQLSDSMNIGIGVIEIEGRQGFEVLLGPFRALLTPFEAYSDVNTIILRNEFALVDFLSHRQGTCKKKHVQEISPVLCDCTQCHEMRLTSFPGLETLQLLEIDEGTVTNYNGINWWDVLLHWIEARKERGVGPGLINVKMVRSDGCPGQAAINGLMEGEVRVIRDLDA